MDINNDRTSGTHTKKTSQTISIQCVLFGGKKKEKNTTNKIEFNIQ